MNKNYIIVEEYDNARYNIISPSEDEFFIYDGNYHMNLEEIVDRLNKQDEEIKFLKRLVVLLRKSN